MRCPQWIRTCVKLFRCEAGWNQAAVWNKKSSSRTRSLLLLHQVKYCSEPGCSAQPSSNNCHLKKWKWSSEKKKSWRSAPNLADFSAALYSITQQRVQYMRKKGAERSSLLLKEQIYWTETHPSQRSIHVDHLQKNTRLKGGLCTHFNQSDFHRARLLLIMKAWKKLTLLIYLYIYISIKSTKNTLSCALSEFAKQCSARIPLSA